MICGKMRVLPCLWPKGRAFCYKSHHHPVTIVCVFVCELMLAVEILWDYIFF